MKGYDTFIAPRKHTLIIISPISVATGQCERTIQSRDLGQFFIPKIFCESVNQ